MKQRRITLSEQEIPEYWYNIRADMQHPSPPYLDCQRFEPVEPTVFGDFFPDETVEQMSTKKRWIAIPDAVRTAYSLWRPTPLQRAYELEKALDTPAKIYFKNEAGSLTNSHKINTAFPQCYYQKEAGCKRVVSEVGSGQWGLSLCLAAHYYGLTSDAFMVKLSHLREQYNSVLMKLWGGEICSSPSRSTQVGQHYHDKYPFSTGVLGIAIAESLEMTVKNRSEIGYVVGSIFGHVDIHQSIIGLEMIKQFEKIGTSPDVVISAFGSGSAFAGTCYPLMHWAKENQKNIRFIAVESSACPTLSKGEYRYDYVDTGAFMPLIPMYTLGSSFEAPPIFAGNMRYHGAGITASRLLKNKAFEVVAVKNTDAVKGGYRLASSEGLLPAYSTCYAMVAVIQEALKCRESGEEKVLVFCLDGLGDLSAGATALLSSTFQLLEPTDEEIQQSLRSLQTPQIEA